MRQEWDVGVQLIDHPEYSDLRVERAIEVLTQTVHIANATCLEIQEQRVVGIGQHDGVLLLIGEQRHRDGHHVLALLVAHVAIVHRGLHRIAAGMQACVLVFRILVLNDILDDGRHLDVTTLLQPRGDTSVIEVVHTQLLVVQQQGHQFMYVLSNQVTLGVDHEALITQEG